MVLTDELCHTASIAIKAPADAVFDFLRDEEKLGRWTFGSWGTHHFRPGVACGTSLFDGTPTYINISAHRHNLQVDYAVGKNPDELVSRISARVLDGVFFDGGKGSCAVTMISWRTRGISDETWRLICAAHEAEVFRLRHVVENENGEVAHV